MCSQDINIENKKKLTDSDIFTSEELELFDKAVMVALPDHVAGVLPLNCMLNQILNNQSSPNQSHQQ